MEARCGKFKELKNESTAEKELRKDKNTKSTVQKLVRIKTEQNELGTINFSLSELKNRLAANQTHCVQARGCVSANCITKF